MRDFLSSLGMAGITVVLVAAMIFAAGAGYIVYLSTLGKATVNAQREVITHTFQYVQTHQQVLMNLYSDWTIATDEAHKNAARLQICAESILLDPLEWPAPVAPFIVQHCQ